METLATIMLKQFQTEIDAVPSLTGSACQYQYVGGSSSGKYCGKAGMAYELRGSLTSVKLILCTEHARRVELAGEAQVIPRLASSAFFSPDRRYRYWLARIWDPRRPVMCTIGLNPSKAGETANDHTIGKELGFALRLNFGGLLKLNVGAYCATDPKEWRRADDPFGPENEPSKVRGYIDLFRPGAVIATWGESGGAIALKRELDLLHALRDLNVWCFGVTRHGFPRHTARAPYNSQLQLLTSAEVSQ